MDRSYQLEASAPETVMLADYQLALKIFINRDIARSFAMVQKLQPAVFRSFGRGLMSESLFIKITTLYLTEVGLLLKPQEDRENVHLAKTKRLNLASALRNNVVFDQMGSLYGSIAESPSELIFHVFLVYYTCQDQIDPEKTVVLEKFTKTYHQLDFQGREKDRHLKRWFDMFVLNVLPESGDFATAYAIAQSNPVFGGDGVVAKLKEVEEAKKKEYLQTQKQKKQVQAQEAKRVAAEKEQQKKEATEKNLKYRTLKQIKEAQESRESSRGSSTSKETSVSPLTFDRIVQRLVYYYTLFKKLLRNHSPVVLAGVILLLVAGKVLGTRKINWRKKLADTMSMAFKVTYL